MCRGITDQDIKDAVANGAESYREIRDLLDLGTCCGRCAPEARAIISDEVAELAGRLAVAA
ncbi:(2Fe-2S)-binding protein [Acinetobacter indicus]|nr:(2Fe-2S)-binding protein [Acinetobacter indicus]MDM1243435.1 (2Fe-2S)-binding protein [Acinetobacter indicus]MDM1261617.1 (2Fe-2S)-binding protein [Acinetobacter indicus]MDM1268995.1 (2Fe-2S)-binding protein [Acinetobacter indicus]MDM1272200.1 (2Fe-2S)-binding protein [Acinetobacter indicus]